MKQQVNGSVAINKNHTASGAVGQPGTDLRARHHPTCFVCSPVSVGGLGLTFHAAPDDALMCEHTFEPKLEGYSGIVHGGILAAALDGAMTNWLLVHGHPAVTAELKVRFRHPVSTGLPVTLRARLVEHAPPIFVMAAEAFQYGQRVVTATAKFVENASSARITEAQP